MDKYEKIKKIGEGSYGKTRTCFYELIINKNFFFHRSSF
jgi:hypothetical protein